jgi:hypothetical protein
MENNNLMIIFTLIIVIFLNLIDVLLAAFILGDFNSPNAYALAAIEIAQLIAGCFIFGAAVVIQVISDANKEIHIPVMFNCILLSAVGIHTIAHVLPLTAAIRYAWYQSTVAADFLDVYGVLVGLSAVATIAGTVSIYAALEVLVANGTTARVLAETRKKLGYTTAKELQV